MMEQDDLRLQLREALEKINSHMRKLNNTVETIEANQFKELTWVDVGDAKSLEIRLDLLLQDLPNFNE